MDYDFDTETFHYGIPIQIRFSDLDALNHVNNGFQCHYFDVGRINYFSAALNRKVDWANQVVVLVHTEFDFISPVEGEDNIIVQTKTLGFGPKSIKMFQRIVDKETLKVKTTCYSVLSGFDRNTKKSIPIPDEYREKFLAFEQTK